MITKEWSEGVAPCRKHFGHQTFSVSRETVLPMEPSVIPPKFALLLATQPDDRRSAKAKPLQCKARHALKIAAAWHAYL